MIDNKYLHSLSPNRHWPTGGSFVTIDPHDILTGHEVGHAFSLPHVNDSNLMMFPSLADNTRPADDVADNVGMTSAEVTRARASACSVPGTTQQSSVSVPIQYLVLAQDTIVEKTQPNSVAPEAYNMTEVNGFKYQDAGDFINGIRIKLEGPLEGLQESETGDMTVIVLIDNDVNLDTGGNATALATFGFPPFGMTGVEYAVRFKLDEQSVVSDQRIFEYNTGANAFDDRSEEVNLKIEVLSLVLNAMVAPYRNPDGSIVGVEPFEEHLQANAVQITFSDESDPKLSDQYRLSALTVDPSRGVVDVIGDEPAGLLLNPNVPSFPNCFAPADANPQVGETVDIEFFGLVPSQPVHGLLGPVLVAKGAANEEGNGVLIYKIPEGTKHGRHLVTIGTDGTALTADCFIDVNNG